MIDEAKSRILPGGCRLISLPEITDERGSLSFLQGASDIPFPIERVFWIWGVPSRQSRGGHAHRTCHEVVFPLSGAFTMHVDDGERQADVVMDSPTCGILIPAGIWCRLSDFIPGTVCVAVASQAYDASGYINSYEAYLNEMRNKK